MNYNLTDPYEIARFIKESKKNNSGKGICEWRAKRYFIR